jgi:hypothetical protein
MLYTDKDFKDMYFPIHTLTSQEYDKIDKMQQFDKISHHRFHKQQKVQILKVLAYLYDIQSPLVSQYTDIMARRDKALELAQVSKTNQAELYKILRDFEHQDLIIVTAEMLRKQNDTVFSLLVSQEIFFSECLTKVLQPIQGEDDKETLSALEKKAKISETMQQVVDRIDKFRSRYFRNDQDLEKKVRTVVSFTPEGIANM